MLTDDKLLHLGKVPYRKPCSIDPDVVVKIVGRAGQVANADFAQKVAMHGGIGRPDKFVWHFSSRKIAPIILTIGGGSLDGLVRTCSNAAPTRRSGNRPSENQEQATTLPADQG